MCPVGSCSVVPAEGVEPSNPRARGFNSRVYANSTTLASGCSKWRRGRDLNPRELCGPYSLSRRAPSTRLGHLSKRVTCVSSGACQPTSKPAFQLCSGTLARTVGFEPTTNAFGMRRSTRLNYARTLVQQGGLEPPIPFGNMALNHARMPVPPLLQNEGELTSNPLRR